MPHTNTSQSRILIIDDSTDIHRLLSMRLKDQRAEILGAMSGAEGVELARQRLPDLILLDIDMPGLGGFETLQALKNDLDTRSKELAMREQELHRDSDANAAREEKSWAELARFFLEGEPDELSKKLSTFDPKDAAKILHQMDDERAIALVNALPQDQYKAFLDAYRKSVK